MGGGLRSCCYPWMPTNLLQALSQLFPDMTMNMSSRTIPSAQNIPWMTMASRKIIWMCTRLLQDLSKKNYLAIMTLAMRITSSDQNIQLGYIQEFNILCGKDGSCGLGYILGPKSRDIDHKMFLKSHGSWKMS